ncbi:hypothetical protein Y032_0001g458 [Ancylostoma ceylanicum]|uniref:Uncharacterized protein n=1 Tax=Ancylostoma ceylanicum TaxID=53326 RepID=A0A016W403_9BILA|nr:hypothetical protein Y032_0001g458 [Ancylostoma ceylanicum]
MVSDKRWDGHCPTPSKSYQFYELPSSGSNQTRRRAALGRAGFHALHANRSPRPRPASWGGERRPPPPQIRSTIPCALQRRPAARRVDARRRASTLQEAEPDRLLRASKGVVMRRFV